MVAIAPNAEPLLEPVPRARRSIVVTTRVLVVAISPTLTTAYEHQTTPTAFDRSLAPEIRLGSKEVNGIYSSMQIHSRSSTWIRLACKGIRSGGGVDRPDTKTMFDIPCTVVAMVSCMFAGSRNVRKVMFTTNEGNFGFVGILLEEIRR